MVSYKAGHWVLSSEARLKRNRKDSKYNRLQKRRIWYIRQSYPVPPLTESFHFNINCDLMDSLAKPTCFTEEQSKT